MDASFRLMSSNISIITKKVIENGGLFTFTYSSHSVYAATHPQMYEYLPTDIQSLKQLDMQEANMVIYPTRKVYQNFLHWWYLCALEVKCQAPPNITRPCPLVFQKGGDRHTVYYEFCHRFDQSSMNILVGNLYGYDVRQYKIPGSNLVSIRRNSKNVFNTTLQICSKH